MTYGTIFGMTAARKVKISVSLDAALLGVVDRLAQNEGTSRSAVMERWLKQVSRRDQLLRLEEETAAYYEALTVAEIEEDAALSGASSRAARTLVVDEPSPRRARRRRRA
jgi:metal-responsive CopG/Arc/MetJ family transcriptional regulator